MVNKDSNRTLKYAFAVVTFQGSLLMETLHSIPVGERVLVIDNSITGWSLSRAWNYALDRLLEKEGFEVAVVCNDDIVLQPDTGRNLAEALLFRQHTEPRECAGKEILLVTCYNIRDVDRGSIAKPPVYGPGDLSGFGPRWGQGPDFSCWAATKQLRGRIGAFDEGFPLYFEDNDIHHRIRLEGCEAMSYAPYWHHGSQSLAKANPAQRAIINEKYAVSKQRFLDKWGALPPNEDAYYKTPWNSGKKNYYPTTTSSPTFVTGSTSGRRDPNRIDPTQVIRTR